MPFGFVSRNDVTIIFYKEISLYQEMNERDDLKIFFECQIPDALLEELREFWLEPGFIYSEKKAEISCYELIMPFSADRAAVAERIANKIELEYSLKVSRFIVLESDKLFSPLSKKPVQSFLLI